VEAFSISSPERVCRFIKDILHFLAIFGTGVLHPLSTKIAKHGFFRQLTPTEYRSVLPRVGLLASSRWGYTPSERLLNPLLLT